MFLAKNDYPIGSLGMSRKGYRRYSVIKKRFLIYNLNSFVDYRYSFPKGSSRASPTVLRGGKREYSRGEVF